MKNRSLKQNLKPKEKKSHCRGINVWVYLLPEPLEKEELYNCFNKMSHGDTLAREEIIRHNIRFVIDRVKKLFNNTPYELNELVSIGIIGLIKSVDTFDIKKGAQFTTYASKCICNEILTFMKKR